MKAEWRGAADEYGTAPHKGFAGLPRRQAASQ